MRGPVYLDCNATTPLEPRVREAMLRYFDEEFGNAGSRTHEYGARAKQAVESAREQVAAVVAAQRDEVIFTSGATEANNLAILGLAPEAERAGRKHIVSTMIEHKAVLEPLDHLRSRGFDVTLVPPTSGGWVEPEAVASALRPDTVLVSVMGANNETGIIQPIPEIARELADHPAYFHVDAAQAFGKEIDLLRDPRIDLISVSAHKVYGPKGVGALITRRRRFKRPPLAPLMFGGGQEKGLRPGTLPVPLVVGLGVAAELASVAAADRRRACADWGAAAASALAPLAPSFVGDPQRRQTHVLCFFVPRLDSEALLLACKDLVAFSNGSACTSTSYKPSHVLQAMGLPAAAAEGTVRVSWSHGTEAVDWVEVIRRVQAAR